MSTGKHYFVEGTNQPSISSIEPLMLTMVKRPSPTPLSPKGQWMVQQKVVMQYKRDKAGVVLSCRCPETACRPKTESAHVRSRA